MTPNSYQQQVLDDLRAFLVRWQACDDVVLAYRAHWDAKGASGMPGYRPLPHGVPQVCAKVPTAGGKTLIGSESTTGADPKGASAKINSNHRTKNHDHESLIHSF